MRNAVLLLDLLSEGPAFRQLSDIAESAELSVPTVHRLLRSLVLADLVEQDPSTSRYGLGPELTRLSQRYLTRLPMLSALSPYLMLLRRSTGCSVYVALLVRGSVVYVDHVEGEEPSNALYRDSVRDSPALATASGRVLAARANDEQWSRALDLVDESDRTVAEESREDWATARYLLTLDQETMSEEVAVPVIDAQGKSVAALSVRAASPLPVERVDDIAAQLTRASGAAARSLGHG